MPYAYIFFVQSSNNKIDKQINEKKEASSMNFEAYMFMRQLKMPSLAKLSLTDNIDLRTPN